MAAGHGLISSAHLDPIEKKPLYHFHPGTQIFSIGGYGCNLACQFCQNWSISQQGPEEGGRCEAATVVERAKAEGSTSIAYTYNEPLINYEFVMECCSEARRQGLLNVLVTNGFINSGPAAELLPLVDALNIDVKSMDEAFYGEHCGASLAPVLDFSRQAVAAGCHVEITNLVIPGLNDDPELFDALSAWMAQDLGRQVPLHLSAYFPQYKMSRAATPPVTLDVAFERCRRHLSYVYLGNARSSVGQDTRCIGCGEVLVQRRGYRVEIRNLRQTQCGKCGKPADFRV